MVRRTKPSKKKKTEDDFQLDHVLAGIDLMLAGHNSVVGPGFLLERRAPDLTYVGHYDPDDLQKFDQAFVSLLINIKSIEKIIIPDGLNNLCQIYSKRGLGSNGTANRLKEKLITKYRWIPNK